MAPYRAIADSESEYVREWMAYEVVSRPHLARIMRIRGEQDRRAYRRHTKDRFWPHGYGWLRRAYGRKQRRNR